MSALAQPLTGLIFVFPFLVLFGLMVLVAWLHDREERGRRDHLQQIAGQSRLQLATAWRRELDCGRSSNEAERRSAGPEVAGARPAARFPCEGRP